MSTFGNSFELFNKLKDYLPKYLSKEGEEKLFSDLKDFITTKQIKNFYSNKVFLDILQGDGIQDLLIINLPSERIEKQKGIILSNTCDLDRKNKSFISSRIIYCPIIKFTKFIEILKRREPSEKNKIEDYASEIKNQKISQFFYLPVSDNLQEESIVLLDRINNCQLEHYKLDDLLAKRLFSLSDTGFYLFVYKLSIHLMRIRENVRRWEA